MSSSEEELSVTGDSTEPVPPPLPLAFLPPPIPRDRVLRRYRACDWAKFGLPVWWDLAEEHNGAGP